MRTAAAVGLFALGLADLIWLNLYGVPKALASAPPPALLASASLAPNVTVERSHPTAPVVTRARAAAPPPRAAAPASPPPQSVEVPALFPAVTFGTGTSDVDIEGAETLRRVAVQLRRNAPLGVTLTGHADRRGSASVNRRLARQRAGAARALLASLGVEPDRIKVVSAGADRPVASGMDAASLAANRRVEIELWNR